MIKMLVILVIYEVIILLVVEIFINEDYNIDKLDSNEYIIVKIFN